MTSHRFVVHKDPHIRFAIVAMVSLLLCAAAGCEQIGKVVDDAKSEVSGTTTDSPPVTTVPADSPPIAPPVTPPVAPPVMEVFRGPTPEQMVVRFMKLAPGEITDQDLSQLAATPEAVAAITQIDLSGNRKVSRAGLSHLAVFKNLVSLTIAGSPLLAADLAILGDVQSLQQLSVAATLADDAVVARLATIPHLTKLDLRATPVTSAVGTSLSRLVELTELSLSATVSDDVTARQVAALPLRHLDFTSTRISNVGLQQILDIPTLEVLLVPFTRVTGIAFKGHAPANLKELNVGETSFGIEGFDAISGMKSLEILNVYKAGLVEHKRANVFRTFPNLRILNAGSNSVTDAGMDVFFKGLKNVEELHLAYNERITNRGLQPLVGIKSLVLLDVTGTACGAAGAMALKQKLPDCKILTDDGKF